MSFSLETVLEEVPEDTRLWKPDTAPQAMVMKSIGNSGWPFTTKPLNAGSSIDGLVKITPITPLAIMPKSKNTLK